GRVVMHNAKYLEPYPELKARGAIGYTFVENLRFIRGHGAYPEAKTEAEFEKLVARLGADFSDPADDPIVIQVKPGFWAQVHHRRTADGGLVLIRTDISAIKQAEARLRDAIESLDSGFCLFGADGRVVMHNAKYLEPYPELKARGAIGYTFVENLRFIRGHGAYPEYKTEAEFEALVTRAEILLRDPPAEPTVVQPKPGFWIQTHYHRTADGGLVTIRTDISAIKQAEARLRDAIESLDSGFCLFDAADRVVLHNSILLESYPELMDKGMLGFTFEQNLRRAWATGRYYPQCKTEAEFEAFVAQQIRYRTDPPSEPAILELQPGRWIQYHMRRTADGGLVTIRTDISAIKQAEAAARLAEVRLRDAIESLDSGVCLFAHDGRITLHNSKYLAPYQGLAETSVIGLTFDRLFRKLRAIGGYPDIKTEAEFEAFVARNVEMIANPPRDPLVIQTMPGYWVQVNFRGTADGGMVMVRTDVTALKRAEARLRDAVEAMDGGFALWDADDRLSMHNAAYLAPYPTLALSGVAGRSFAELQTRLFETGSYPHFADRAAFEAWLTEQLRSRREQPGKARINRIRGRWYQTVEHRTAEGGLVAVRTDITEVRLAEARLREAIEAMDGGFALYDARDRLVMHNDRFREPYPTVVGKTIVGLTFEEFHDLLWETGHYARFADRTAFDAWFEPLKRIRRDSPGSPHVIQFANRHWYRVVDHRTADGGLVMIRTEITDLKEQQDRLQLLADDYALARDRAEAADRAKSDFLATMSHEIRTPLNGIVGLTYILARTKLEDAQRRHLEGIRTSGELLLSVVNDILDFSKLEAGRVRLEAIPFDPAAVIDLVRTTLGDLARGKGLALSVDLPDSTFALLSDPNRIGQVLLNLVGNAIKFTDKGGIKIRLLLTAGREAGQVRLRCEVIDTGIGIDAEAQSRLFQRFTQADSSTTRRFGGTGLGLAISKHIVDLMGGTIGVDSARGRGSTFWFELPLRLAEQAIAAATESAAGGKTAPRRLRILLVDDNEINRMVIAGMLGEEHELDQAENGVEALEAVKTRDHDLVLMDVQMPVMDGPAAVARIRAMDGAKAKLPIVALTANAMPGDRERYLASGFDDYVSKPVEIELLKAAIARLTGRALDLQAGVRPQAAAPLDAGQEAALAEFLSGIDSAGKPN
ncbi:MAG: response regulator, partial [Alphaproteobacteria bacterium]|nr:response regulator [Alphaproteobacteria bacterium]